MSVELLSASSLELSELAELFTAAYEGYVVPFAVSEEQLRLMVEAFDLDLDASLVAYRDGEPVGLCKSGRARRARARATPRGAALAGAVVHGPHERLADALPRSAATTPTPPSCPQRPEGEVSEALRDLGAGLIGRQHELVLTL